MVKVLIQEYKNSVVIERLLPTKHAHNLGLNGGFYKVQILGEFNQIEFEYN